MSTNSYYQHYYPVEHNLPTSEERLLRGCEAAISRFMSENPVGYQSHDVTLITSRVLGWSL